MKNTLQLILLFSIIILGACQPKYYMPNYQDVPMLEQEGDFNIAINGNTNQLNFNGAYAIKPNIAFKGQYGYYIPQEDSLGNGGSGSLIEVGFGYFKPLSEKINFECFGLFGSGHMENHFTGQNDKTGNIDADIFRYGLQPAIGYSHENLEFAISSRLAAINYKRIRGDLTFKGDNQIDYLQDKPLQMILEPAFTVKFGLENIKFTSQLGFSLNLLERNFPQDKLYLGLGLVYQKRNKDGWRRVR